MLLATRYSFHENRILSIEFYIFSITFILSIFIIRFYTFTPWVCGSSTEISHIAGSITAFHINCQSMYSLDLIILYLSIEYVHRYNKLNKIISICNDIDKIKNEFDNIQKEINIFKSKWQFVATISCLYHVIFVTLRLTVWLSDTSKDLWMYCGSDSFTQLFVVIVRSSLRIFGLIYGIIRINHKPKQLSKQLNKYGVWNNNQLQQIKIQRFILSLIHFPNGFKVCWIAVHWKHFVGIIASAITATFASLVRIKFA